MEKVCAKHISNIYTISDTRHKYNPVVTQTERKQDKRQQRKKWIEELTNLSQDAVKKIYNEVTPCRVVVKKEYRWFTSVNLYGYDSSKLSDERTSTMRPKRVMRHGRTPWDDLFRQKEVYSFQYRLPLRLETTK